MTKLRTLRNALMMTAATLGGTLVATLPDRPAYAQEAVRTYAIPAQDLDGALRAFAVQTGRDVLYPPHVVAGKRSPGVQGRRTERQALTALLAGTGLRFEQTASNGYVVQDPASPTRAGEAGGEMAVANLEEVVVTGTHIRGTAPVGSPVLVFTQEDFQNAGADTIQEFMTTVTQAAGTARGPDRRSIPGDALDLTFGSGIDLRGLGAGTTLVLLNGRRLAPSGGASNVDISMIPLSGVQEIQILTDGASALYGSDAVGGVVNIIMRENYTGAQTTASVGVPTRGGGEQFRASQSFGTGWGTGSALFNLEYNTQSAIEASDRQSIQNNPVRQGTLLTPDQESVSVFGTIRQTITPDIEVFANIGYSERQAGGRNNFTSSNFVIDWDSFNANTNAVTGVNLALPGDWTAEISASSNLQETDATSVDSRGDDLFGSQISRYETASLEASLTGTLVNLPAGPLSGAFGVGYRSDAYEQRGVGNSSTFTPRQTLDVNHVFAELRLPLLGPLGDIEDPRLVMSLAGRYDDYNEFGSSANPRIGLEWTAIPGLKLRTAYSTSYRVPTLEQSDTTDDSIWFFPSLTFGSIQDSAVDPNLGPETSTNWSAGVVIQPPTLRGFRVEVNWYDINYSDRIALPPSLCNFGPDICGIGGPESDPAMAELILERGEIPDAEFDALVSEYLSGERGQVIDLCVIFGMTCNPMVPSSFSVIYSQGLRNVAETHESGLDLRLRQDVQMESGSLELALDATYIFELERRLTSNSPVTDFVNRSGEPIQMRLRSGATWRSDNWTFAGFANYTGEHLNTNITPNVEVPSQTTFDLTVRRDFSSTGTSVVLNIANLFDDLPPPIRLGNGFSAYDNASGDPWGMVVSLAVIKNW